MKIWKLSRLARNCKTRHFTSLIGREWQLNVLKREALMQSLQNHFLSLFNMQISEALVVLMADSSPNKWQFCESVFSALHLRILCRAANWNRNPLENSILILQFTLVSMQYYIVLEYTVSVWSQNVLQLDFSQDLLFFSIVVKFYGK